AGGYQGEIGITLNFTWVDAASHRAEDETMSRYADGFFNRWFVEPITQGRYPADMIPFVESQIGKLSYICPGDLDAIAAKVDFLGVNYYTRNVVAADPSAPLGVRMLEPPADRVTAMGWEIHPQSLYRLLNWLQTAYTGDLTLLITENGAAFQDHLVAGEVHDEERIEYIADHLEAAKRFIDEGGPLKGYYLWSFMDNFEWAFGYSKRFGLVYVDYETQDRIVKDSGKWYSEQISYHRSSQTR
ncbi:family 1 glycosylhydrolase, partial [Alicyclobacillus fastidiosus]